MDHPKTGLIRKVFIEWGGSEIFSEIRPHLPKTKIYQMRPFLARSISLDSAFKISLNSRCTREDLSWIGKLILSMFTCRLNELILKYLKKSFQNVARLKLYKFNKMGMSGVL